jgi:5-methyltetrahydrofolate--homocysteine methyltransferase
MHTAVKIDPAYGGTVIHVLDASRSVPVCQALMDPANAVDFAEEIREEYDQLRTEFYAGLEDRTYVDIAVARERKFKVCLCSAAIARLCMSCERDVPLKMRLASSCALF